MFFKRVITNIKDESFTKLYKKLSSILFSKRYNFIPTILTSEISTDISNFKYRPHFSIIILSNNNSEEKNIAQTTNSINNQFYSNFEIHVSTKTDSLNIIRSLRTDYLIVMDAGDVLTEDALYLITKSLNKNKFDFVYSDHDIISSKGYTSPQYKPDFSPETLAEINYIENLITHKISILKSNLGNYSYNYFDNYKFLLLLSKTNISVKHIPKVLYHTSTSNNYKLTPVHNKTELTEKPLISIIIPFKDKPDLLKKCIHSIINKSSYSNFEIIAVDNMSINNKTKKIISELKLLDNRIKFIEYKHPFNYSAINNHAINNYAKGLQILLLNSDTKVISNDWIESMLQYSQQESIGAVGAKLIYKNKTIQHAGIVIGLGEEKTAGHSHRFFKVSNPGYQHRLETVCNVSAVTGACLMIKKSLFIKAAGFDEVNLPIIFNDVDFCLRLLEMGYRNIFTPYATLYHYESISRKNNINQETAREKSVSYFKNRHQKKLLSGDKYYNTNLSIEKDDYSIK